MNDLPAAAVVTHARGIPVDRAALQRVVGEHKRPSTARRRLRELVDSVGTGFLYGTILGGVLAAIQGYRESPQHQRLRGVLHHSKHSIPVAAGHMASATIAFRLASWGLESVRAETHADLWDVLLAAPLAGALLRWREGPRAAAQTALVFGSIGAIMIGVNLTLSKVRNHGDSPDEVLEEIAFAQEVDE